ncbi:hypothetical protein DBV15_04928 [Temnothorax longispinosus]|uniref:Uncharacterized protein n=1 Tax=Temnothorax longispinosus TaxID=300112 RepID=A0A4S2KZS0_9HYME|nr:hypothetical protein DBV15_04928 [Temnothorax longispinosus]
MPSHDSRQLSDLLKLNRIDYRRDNIPVTICDRDKTAWYSPRRGCTAGSAVEVLQKYERPAGSGLRGQYFTVEFFQAARISAKLAVVAYTSAGVHGNYYGEVACMSYGRDLHSADPPHRLYFISKYDASKLATNGRNHSCFAIGNYLDEKKGIMKKHLPLVELYSPMYRLVKYRTTTAATEREKGID